MSDVEEPLPTVVVHRKPHPTVPNTRRWFTYKGRDYGVMYGGPGWGYSIHSLPDLYDVAEGFFYLYEVREQGAAAVERWLEEEAVIEYMRTHDGERPPGSHSVYAP